MQATGHWSTTGLYPWSLIFLVFINDLNHNCHPDKLVLFADDTTFLTHGVSNDDFLINQERHLATIQNWFVSNKLKLNVDKTQHIFFSTYTTNVQSVKCLGVHVDNKLQWHTHVDYLARKLAICTFQIRKLIKLTNIETTKCYYYSNFQSILSYGVTLWGMCASVERLFVIQKYAIRAMCCVKHQEHCKPLFAKLNILTLPCLLILECLLFVKANMNNQESQKHSYNTRHNEQLYIPLHRLTRTQRQPIFYMSTKLFNSISRETQSLPMAKFKLVVRKYLLQEAFYSLDEFLTNCQI